jgi:hypothetical protein
MVRMVALLPCSSCADGMTKRALFNSHKASFSFTGIAPQTIQGVLHYSLVRTPQSLHQLALMPLGSMGDPSGNCDVTLIIPFCILFKDRIPMFFLGFWGLGSCSRIARVVLSWGVNKFRALLRGGGF